MLGIDSLNSYYDPALKQARLQRLQGRNGFRFRQVDIADEAALKLALADVLPDTPAHRPPRRPGRRALFDRAAGRVCARQSERPLQHAARLARLAPKLEHLVYASSSSVYGASKKVPFSLEDAADHPVSLYAATKRADELLSVSYARIFKLRQTGLRFFTVYGPWGRPDMAYYKFTKAILAGTPIEIYAGGALQRDFTYIDDIVAGVLAAIDRPPPADAEEPHRLYNLGNDRPESVNALVTAIEAACGRKAQRIDKPMPLGDVPKTWADISVSRQDLGYAPTIRLDEGIRRFVAWYRDYAKV